MERVEEELKADELDFTSAHSIAYDFKPRHETEE